MLAGSFDDNGDVMVGYLRRGWPTTRGYPRLWFSKRPRHCLYCRNSRLLLTFDIIWRGSHLHQSLHYTCLGLGRLLVFPGIPTKQISHGDTPDTCLCTMVGLLSWFSRSDSICQRWLESSSGMLFGRLTTYFVRCPDESKDVSWYELVVSFGMGRDIWNVHNTPRMWNHYEHVRYILFRFKRSSLTRHFRPTLWRIWFIFS